MPKKQPTAAKKARTAAMSGSAGKHTQLLRAELATRWQSPDTWDPDVVSALTAFAAGPVPITHVPSLEKRRFTGLDVQRWGVAEATPGGYSIREYLYEHQAVAALVKGERLPVPYAAEDGTVQVAGLWPLVWTSSTHPGWRWAHTGWAVTWPGRIADCAHPPCPSPDLPYEVRVYEARHGLVGETYHGGPPSWSTWGWCTTEQDAVEVADALIATRTNWDTEPGQGRQRAQVWHHDIDGQAARVHQIDAAPDRPEAPRPPRGPLMGRPHRGTASAEPRWTPDTGNRAPDYELRVWDPQAGGWRSLIWCEGGRSRCSFTALHLGVGAGGRYPWAVSWATPLHAREPWRPSRTWSDVYPEMHHQESEDQYRQERQEEAERLARAIAHRSGGHLTAAGVAHRITTDRDYEHLIQVARVQLADAVRTALRTTQGDTWDRWRAAGLALDRDEVIGELAEVAKDARRICSDRRRWTESDVKYVQRALDAYLAGPAGEEDE